MGDDNLICIGDKPFMNYVTGVIMQFITHDASDVIVKSRGKFISRAVDVVEVVTNKYLKDKIKVDGINIDSELFINNLGKEVRVSTMDIKLVKL